MQLSRIKKLIAFFLLFGNFLNNSYSQSVHNQTFPSFEAPIITLPKIPLDSIVQEQAKHQAYVFAYPFRVSINVLDKATHFSTQENDIYVLKIFSEEAKSLNLIFGKFNLPEGAELKIFNEDSTSSTKVYTHKNNNQLQILATPIIYGNQIVVYYKQPKGVSKNTKLQIEQVSHGFSSVLKSTVKQESGSCNVDVNCIEGNNWQKEKNSVVRLLIGGTRFCSGTILNNTLNDGKPYVLTANHCLETERNAARTVFYFDFENESCGSLNANDERTISGSNLRATAPDNEVDFTLLELSETPPDEYGVFYAGWDASETPSEISVSLHHPKGDPMKISIDYDFVKSKDFETYEPDTHWEVVDWEVGTTEGGSSGSALFNQDHYVVGSLSGGYAICQNPVKDYYSKFSVAYNRYSDSSQQLKYWLDPLNSGVTQCPSYSPYPFMDSIDAYGNNEPLFNLSTKNNISDWGSGLYLPAKCISNFYEINHKKNICAISLGVKQVPDTKQYTHFYVWNEQNVLAHDSVLNSRLKEKYKNQLYFSDLISVDSDCYVGICFEDTNGISLYQYKEEYEEAKSHFKTEEDGDWWSYVGYGIEYDFAMYPITSEAKYYFNEDSVRIVYSKLGNTRTYQLKQDEALTLYPTVCKEEFKLVLKKSFYEEIQVKIYDNFGVLVQTSTVTYGDGGYTVPIQGLPSGFYIVKSQVEGKMYENKLVIYR